MRKETHITDWKVLRNIFALTTLAPYIAWVLAVIAACLCVALLRTEATAAGGITLVVNPYEDIDWERVEQYRMNVHTHTTESDGRLPVDQVIDEYHARNYHALAITDHDRNTWPWTDFDRDPDTLGMLAIPGNELSRHHHTLSLFSTYETDETDHDAALTGLADAGGLAILCHPAMHWLREHHASSAFRVVLIEPLRALAMGDFSIEAWFRTTDEGRNILLGNYSGDYEGALNLELHTDNRVRMYVQPHGEGRTTDLSVRAGALDIDTRDGQWHHLAGIRRDNVVYLYLDGRLAGQRSDHAGAFFLQGDALFIGRDSRTGGTVFEGDLARVRLWRRALSEDDLLSLVTGAPVNTDGLLAQYIGHDSTAPGAPSLPADTAGHPEGPFHAEVVGAVLPQVVADAPEVLSRADRKAGALHFGPGEFPQSVPEAAVEHYIALFLRHPHLVATEVHNRTRPDREYPLDRELWDRLLTALMPERPVWAVAVDDMHGMQHLGGDWIMALAAELDEHTVRAALTQGRYYFASTRLHEPDAADVARTPRVESIVHDSATGRILANAVSGGETLPDSAYVWISEGRAIHEGPVLAYRDIPEVGVYVRLEITGPGGTAYTNPFGFRR